MDRDTPGLWSHLLSKERTLVYIATAGDGLQTHTYAISRAISTFLDSQILASHAYQSSRAYDTLGESATPCKRFQAI